MPAAEIDSPLAEMPGTAPVGPTLMALAVAEITGESALGAVVAGGVPVGVGVLDSGVAGDVPVGVRMSEVAVAGAALVPAAGVVVDM